MLIEGWKVAKMVQFETKIEESISMSPTDIMFTEFNILC